MSKETVCVDFDGVIHEYISPWTTPLIISDNIIPGAAKFLYDCCEEFNIVIHSTRCKDSSAILRMIDWLRVQLSKELTDKEVLQVMTNLTFNYEKVKAIIYIDDRGYRFEGRFPTVDEIKELKSTWNKKK